jgi:hypothetical protein
MRVRVIMDIMPNMWMTVKSTKIKASTIIMGS